MGVRGLQSYILAKCPDSLVPVELSANNNENKKKRLIVVEGWSCLRSVYGPHMDFICGGQWQEFRASIRRFVTTFQQAGCELVVFFSGGVEDNMRCEWARRKTQARDTVNMVMQGLRQRGHPPDRKHFLPNETHPQVFRQVLLSCHVKVISTPYSTDKAMVEYAHQNKAYGILANDSDFIMMNAPRYLSLHHLRLSGNTISTVNIDRAKISETLDLPLPLFPLLSCLLGNDVVNYEMLEDFHKRLLSSVDTDDEKKKEGVQLVTVVTDFVKHLSEDIKSDVNGNIKAIVKEVIPDCENSDKWEKLFLSGLEQYKETSSADPEPNPSTVVMVTIAEKEKVKPAVEGEDLEKTDDEEKVEEAKIIEDDVDETKDVKEDSSNGIEEEKSDESKSPDKFDQGEQFPKLITVPAVTAKVLQSARVAHVGGTLNTHLFPLMCTGTFSLGPMYEDVKEKDVACSAVLFRAARQRIYGLVFGVGRGWVKGDSKRQRSPKIDTQRQVTIKEYIVNGSKKQIMEPEEVVALPVHAASAKQPPKKPTPHIDRLWIGMSAKIQELRRSTFLAIMNSNTISLCNPNVVANEYLLVAIVLRYILTSGTRVLREYELDAFLATALSPQLHLGPSHLYKISPGTRLTGRGCSLAHMFVRGVETVLLANDACAYPLPLRYCFIGNFFDGKLFQMKLAQTRSGMSLLDVCDGELYAVDYLRHLRCIITEELPRSVFAPPPPGPMMQGNMRGNMRANMHHRGGMVRHPQTLRPPPVYNEHRGCNQGQGRGMYRPPHMSYPGGRPQYRPANYQPPPVYNNPQPNYNNYKQHNIYSNYNNNSTYNNNNNYNNNSYNNSSYNNNSYNNNNYNNNNYNNNNYNSNNYNNNSGMSRRYNHYEQHENYSDNYHNYNYNHPQNYNNNTNGNYMPYKGQHDNYNGTQQNGGATYYRDAGTQNNGSYQQRSGPYQNGGFQQRSGPYQNGGFQQRSGPYQNGGVHQHGYSKANYKDNDLYGKRSVPDRSDTKRWIEFLGN